MKAIVCALALTAGGCDFAVKHPATTAAITGGTIALGTCEIQGASQKACAVISGGAAALLGLTAAVALWLAGDQPAEEQTVDPSMLVPDEEKPVHVPTKTEPPPNPDEPARANPSNPTAPPNPTPLPAPPNPTNPAPPSPAPNAPSSPTNPANPFPPSPPPPPPPPPPP